jgi:PRTRC genetic system protein B
MIHSYVQTGNSVELRLQQVALFYAREDHGAETGYVEVRPIIQGPTGPEYGAGRPADAEYLRRMLLGDMPLTLNLLDPRLLAHGGNEAAWWSRPGRQALFFTGDGMKRHDAKSVSMPALVFHVRDGRLRVRALACRGRPTPRTPLYVAPLWNIYSNGNVCMGSMPVPDGPPAERIDAWERAWWDSAFTGPHDSRSCGHPGGYQRMLTELRKLPRFPSRWLVPSGERMAEWLNRR